MDQVQYGIFPHQRRFPILNLATWLVTQDGHSLAVDFAGTEIGRLGHYEAVQGGQLWAAYDLLQPLPAQDQGGVWDRLMNASTELYGRDMQMINGTAALAQHSAAT